MATVTSPPVPPPSGVDTSGDVSRLASGLSSADAQRKLAELGPNEIRREQKTTRLTLLAHQFASPVIGSCWAPVSCPRPSASCSMRWRSARSSSSTR